MRTVLNENPIELKWSPTIINASKGCIRRFQKEFIEYAPHEVNIPEFEKGKFAELRFENGGYSLLDVNDVIVPCEDNWQVGMAIDFETIEKKEEEIL